MNYRLKYQEWLNSSFIDDETKKELKKIENNEKEIEDRFYKDLDFGTGGLRGIMGAGTNRMNSYTIGKATQGLANYICSRNLQERGVVIAYDSRNHSKEFAEQVALVLNANEIKTFLFKDLRPTPELSFAVRELNTIAGIVITASHNPKEYNGYKIYWEDGGQIVPPYDKEIITEVNKIKDLSKIKTISREYAKKLKLFNEIEEEIDDRYIVELEKLIINSSVINKFGKELKIVYTPLHGTGGTLVPKVLKKTGFEKVYFVQTQLNPNGNFPTVVYPNPEEKQAFELALKLANKTDSDIILATDPDADRLGIYVKDKNTGNYMAFSGNMLGLIIAEYILSQKKEKNILPKNGALVKTIVSSNMANDIAKEYNLHLIDVLTGFKYIGEQIKLFEQNKSYEFLFGFEESYGCLMGTYARDKDAIAAVMIVCEIACYAKTLNKTLWDMMMEMYSKYGYYQEDLIYFTLKGKDGTNKINNIMENLRNNPITEIANNKVIAIRDYLSDNKIIMLDNKKEKMNMPNSNVLYYELENNCWVCIRPSGTEPKIKIYIGVKENTLENSLMKLDETRRKVKEILEGKM